MKDFELILMTVLLAVISRSWKCLLRCSRSSLTFFRQLLLSFNSSSQHFTWWIQISYFRLVYFDVKWINIVSDFERVRSCQPQSMVLLVGRQFTSTHLISNEWEFSSRENSNNNEQVNLNVSRVVLESEKWTKQSFRLTQTRLCWLSPSQWRWLRIFLEQFVADECRESCEWCRCLISMIIARIFDFCHRQVKLRYSNFLSLEV